MYGGMFRYIKKKDAEKFLRFQYTWIGIMHIFLAVMYGFLFWYISPQFTTLYESAQISPPPSAGLDQFVGVGVLLIFLWQGYRFLTKKIDKRELKQKLKGYKPTEMILAQQLADTQLIYSTLAIGLVLIALATAILVLPIFYLSAQL